MKTTFALIVSALLATSTVFAEGKACCATQASNTAKMECSQAYAKLNLTPEQKTKLDAAQAKYCTANCTKENMDKFMHSAKRILSAEQFAQLKTECAQMQHCEKTKS
jgi:Spy/CpxP family protein refolding chaperone